MTAQSKPFLAVGTLVSTFSDWLKHRRELNELRQLDTAEFDRIIGIKRVRAFHLNDSVRELGSRVDRHAKIGAGKLGLEPFRHLLNDRRFAKLEGCRRSAFETIDRPAMKPLPPLPYEVAHWTTAKVNIDYHVELDGHYSLGANGATLSFCLMMAIGLATLGDVAKAKEWASRALAIDPDDVMTRYNVACFYSQCGEFDRAYDRTCRKGKDTGDCQRCG
jgi:uncharacterized protein YjiS (DUF1127 family)